MPSLPPPTRPYELLLRRLAQRSGRAIAELRASGGAPLGPQSLRRWAQQGLLSAQELYRLEGLGGRFDEVLIERILSPPEASMGGSQSDEEGTLPELYVRALRPPAPSAWPPAAADDAPTAEYTAARIGDRPTIEQPAVAYPAVRAGAGAPALWTSAGPADLEASEDDPQAHLSAAATREMPVVELRAGLRAAATREMPVVELRAGLREAVTREMPIAELRAGRPPSAPPSARPAHPQEAAHEGPPGREAPQGAARFHFGAIVAQGQIFDLHEGTDLAFERPVALYRLRPEGALDEAAFIEGVRRQARLQHPIIQPIYELERDASGRPFYVSRPSPSQSLADVLKTLGAGHSELSLEQRLELVVDLAHAIAYAHRMGTVHRDLRPQNVWLGRFGEVQLAGWYRARRLTEPAQLSAPLNAVRGGLGFLSPERLQQGLAACDEASDAWGLGAILYALLARRPPLAGRSSADLLSHLQESGVAPVTQHEAVDPILSELCGRLLSVSPRERPAALEVATTLLDFLEGTQVYARRLELLEGHVQSARGAQEHYEGARARLISAVAEAQAARDPAAPERALRLRAAFEPLRQDVLRWFLQVERSLESALALLPQHAPTRQRLQRLYRSAEEDITRGRLTWPLTYVHARLALMGAHPREPRAEGPALERALRVRTQPERLQLSVCALSMLGQRWSLGNPQPLGRTPLEAQAELPERVLLIFSDAQGVRARLPLSLGAQTRLQLDGLALPAWPQPQPRPGAGRPPALVLIPQGEAQVGAASAGDAQHALPEATVTLPSYYIGREPVRFGEYLPFLNALHRRDPERAARHAPRRWVGEAPFWRPGPGGYSLPLRFSEDQSLTAEHPLFGVTLEDAQAWLKWRSEQDQLPWRLPSELEWEKAARGPEGWPFPWGEALDPRLCQCLEGAPQLKPARSAPHDCSIYGVYDLAGGVQEYTSGQRGQAVLRGGAWTLPFERSVASFRAHPSPRQPLSGCGFRVALSVGRAGAQAGAPPWPRLRPRERPLDEEAQPAQWVAQDETAVGLRAEDLTVLGHTVLGQRAPRGAQPSGAGAAEQWPAGADRYLLRETLAQGSMGRVVLAFDQRLQRPVALKLLHETQAKKLRVNYRFAMEARITARLQHPNVVPVYDTGRLADGARFFTMKPIAGQSLGQVLRGLAKADPQLVRRFSLDRLLTILRRVAQGLSYAHARAIVHRDLKPANILIGELGEVAVIDLGLARQLRPDPRDLEVFPEAADLADERGRVTQAGSVIGTPFYMSPEQAMGLQDAVGPRADVYGLGAMLYHVLTGRPPFVGQTAKAVLVQVRTTPPTAPSQIAPERGLLEAFDALCLRALAKEPEERPASAQALGEEIFECQRQLRLEAAQADQMDVYRTYAKRAWQGWQQAVAQVDQLRTEQSVRRAELRGLQGPARRAAVRRLEGQWEAAQAQGLRALSLLVWWSQMTASPNQPEPMQRLAFALQSSDVRLVRGLEAPHAQWLRAWFLRADLSGAYRQWLQSGGPLSVHTQPAPLTVHIEHCPADGSGPIEHWGHSPLGPVPLPAGQGRVALWTDARPQLGAQRVTLPLQIRPGEPAQIDLSWPSVDLRHWALIPAGEFLYGGDPLYDDGPARFARLEHYLIGRRPVTCGEYAAWLTALEAQEPSLSTARAPRLSRRGVLLWSPEGQARFGAFDPERPVTGITLADAQAYAQWRASVEGVPYRLPSSAEWEKAARGIDGRPWPWGFTVDPPQSALKGALHREGAAGQDERPYGLSEIATEIFEWTRTAVRAESLACYVRGGSADVPLPGPPCAHRWAWDPTRPSPYIGFRLVITHS